MTVTRNGAWRVIQAYVEAILGVEGFATSTSDKSIAQRHGLLELLKVYRQADSVLDDPEPDMDAYRLNPPPTVMDEWAEYAERY